MNQQKQIEIIKRKFPDAGETEIRERLNAANKYFIRETRIIQDSLSMLIVDGQTDYKFENLTNPNGGQIIEVLDVEEDKQQSSDFVWSVEDRDTLILGKFQGSDKISAAPAGKVIHIIGVFSDPGYNTDLTKEPFYDEEFHLGIVWRVLADLYLEEGDLNRHAAYKSQYKEIEIAAKKAAGSKGVKGNYRAYDGMDPYHRT